MILQNILVPTLWAKVEAVEESHMILFIVRGVKVHIYLPSCVFGELVEIVSVEVERWQHRRK